MLGGRSGNSKDGHFRLDRDKYKNLKSNGSTTEWGVEGWFGVVGVVSNLLLGWLDGLNVAPAIPFAHILVLILD